MILLIILTALVPFALGTLLAGVAGFPIRWPVFLGGAVGLAALILAAALSRIAFAPEAGRWPQWESLAPRTAHRLALASLALAALLGVILQLSSRTGDLTIPLGGLGILGGYFYFAPPCQWYRRVWGEVVGGLGFGLLPVVTGLYLQTGHLLTETLLYGLPLTFAGYNLFLIHDFPNPQEDAPPRSSGLAARVRPVAAALTYTLVNLLTILGLGFGIFFPAAPLPSRLGLWALIILAVFNQELIKRRAYYQEANLRWLCRLTLLLHLGMGLVFGLNLWWRW
ncbi:MAG: UbiA family prenyltransferase [Thermodesulfobacteriota bacterium]